eukprot:4994377-Pleurochrysis_carterae.AAC.1
MYPTVSSTLCAAGQLVHFLSMRSARIGPSLASSLFTCLLASLCPYATHLTPLPPPPLPSKQSLFSRAETLNNIPSLSHHSLQRVLRSPYQSSVFAQPSRATHLSWNLLCSDETPLTFRPLRLRQISQPALSRRGSVTPGESVGVPSPRGRLSLGGFSTVDEVRMAAPKPKEVLQQLTRRVTDAEAKVDAHYALIALGRRAARL